MFTTYMGISFEDNDQRGSLLVMGKHIPVGIARIGICIMYIGVAKGVETIIQHVEFFQPMMKL